MAGKLKRAAGQQDYVIAQLRHAYEHLSAGRVTNQREFADGLIAPAIRFLERASADLMTAARFITEDGASLSSEEADRIAARLTKLANMGGHHG